MELGCQSPNSLVNFGENFSAFLVTIDTAFRVLTPVTGELASAPLGFLRGFFPSQSEGAGILMFLTSLRHLLLVMIIVM